MDNDRIKLLRHILSPFAALAGVSDDRIDRALADLLLDRRVLELAQYQPEHSRTVGQYVDTLVSAARVATGKAMWELHSDLLKAIVRAYGIPAQILLAIWGIESNFGMQMGTFSVLRSLATLISAGGRRQSFWCEQFVAAVQICERQHLSAAQVTGSWAGAMGHMQFMPTTYRDFAVDFDGDGRADIFSSVADALASAANYLEKSGWQRGMPWGTEIDLAAGFDFNAFADGEPRRLGVWRAGGVRAIENQWPHDMDGIECRLLLPSGAGGPGFLATANFDALLAYNAALSYAVAIALLADRIGGKPSLRKPWPSDIPLTLQERKALQQGLVALGYDTGGIDGILGHASRVAIRQYQIANGLIADGYASRALLENLQKSVKDR